VRVRRIGLISVLPVVLTGLAAGNSDAVAAARPQISLIALLTGVTAPSSQRAWAVGWTDEFSQPSRAVILRWDGKTWTRVSGLRPAVATLEGVAAVSTANAWAVGFAKGGLIMHWTGKTWKRASSPNEGTGGKLLGVAAPSARAAWAVGCVSCQRGGGQQPLVLRWNGRSWLRARLPDAGPSSELLGVAASSAKNAWAVGCTRCGESRSRTLIMHWNGEAWRIARLPATGSVGQLSGVTTLSAGTAWAVGCANCFTGSAQPLILRWNGRSWQRARVPVTSGANNELSGVMALSARSAWAVGSGGRTRLGVPKTLILRWNGKSWKRAPSPNDGSNGGAVVSVDALSAGNAWAVGNNFNDEAQTLILHWNGKAWTTS
jgi:hypothetical protein